jgi:molybdenum cofactor cytidylyltransferase
MICAIVLAAGESRRMGSHKLLLPFGSTTVIVHIVDQLLRSVVNNVLVVVGHDEERVVEQLPGSSVEVVTNPNYRTGMLSSVRCGLQALPQACQAVMVALGDQPALTSELVDEMVRSYSATDKGILVPVYSGRRGHPLLFSAHYRYEILTHYDDVGLRGLMRAHPDDVLDLDVSTPGVLSDMDYPEDYRRELESLDDNA